ncbi:MAG: hypothetical protein RL710_314 [Pseudomonadota bacterium]|jgi:hypothetical protein
MTKGAMRDGVITQADLRGHEAEVMRLLGEIEVLVNEVQA